MYIPLPQRVFFSKFAEGNYSETFSRGQENVRGDVLIPKRHDFT